MERERVRCSKNEDREGFEGERHLGEPEPNGGSSVSQGRVAGFDATSHHRLGASTSWPAGQLAVRE